MSWSITYIGKPDKVAEAITKHSDKLTGQSKIEYDSAMPHLEALVKENFGPVTPLVKVIASGHGSTTNGEQVQRHFTASIEVIYGDLV